MTEKELEKLSRKRLLELLAEQTGRANRLQRENERLKERIAEREQHLSQMVTLARAILKNDNTIAPEDKDLFRKSLKAIKGFEQADEDEETEETDETGKTKKNGKSKKNRKSKKNGKNKKNEETGETGETETSGETEETEITEETEEPPNTVTSDWPTREQLLFEAQREGSKRRYIWSLKTTVYAMITVAAVAVLVAVLLLPVLQIYGSSMNPTLYEGDFVISVKGGKMDTGDLMAFYYNNKILVKRVIGQAGQWIDIAEDGTVYVDNVKINEPYLKDRAFGECDIELPYQVPENRVFVMGDNRSVSVDSRSTSIGCVAEEQVVGKIVFRVWPLSEFGRV